MVHDRQFPAMAGNVACLQIFPDHPKLARALVTKPFDSTLAAQGPADVQGIGQARQRGAQWRDRKNGSRFSRGGAVIPQRDAGRSSPCSCTLHRPARGDGRLVADEPAAQADDRPHDPCHSCRDPPITSTPVMRVIAIKTQTERKRKDKCVHRAEKRRHRARVMRTQALLPERARRSARKNA